MLKGMTGFAQAKGNFKGSQINVEIRSVNHRFFECVVHLPEGLSALEEAVKNQIRVRINRSRLTAVVSVVDIHPKVMVNYELSNGYVRALKQLNHKLKLDNNINLSQIINLEGVFSQ